MDCGTSGSPSFIVSQSLFKLMSFELVMLSNHLILCCLLLLLLSIFPSIRVFSNEVAFRIMWPKYCSFSFSNNPSNLTEKDEDRETLGMPAHRAWPEAWIQVLQWVTWNSEPSVRLNLPGLWSNYRSHWEKSPQTCYFKPPGLGITSVKCSVIAAMVSWYNHYVLKAWSLDTCIQIIWALV